MPLAKVSVAIAGYCRFPTYCTSQKLVLCLFIRNWLGVGSWRIFGCISLLETSVALFALLVLRNLLGLPPKKRAWVHRSPIAQYRASVTLPIECGAGSYSSRSGPCRSSFL